MQDLTIGLFQLDQVWQDKKANFEHIAKQLTTAPKLDLLLLPEMFHTGFSMEMSCADDWQHSQGLHFLKELSQIHQMAIYTSLMVKDGSAFFNRGVFVFPHGEVVTYDKRKTFGLGGEDQYFQTGNKEVIVNFLGWKLNLQICYDLRFPELVRNRISQEGEVAYDVLLNVANWPQKRIAHWDALIKARAIENQCYFLGCNRIGQDGNQLVYNGHSQAVDLIGDYLAAPHEQEGLYVVICSGSTLKKGRKSLPFLKDA
jgi:predicted amidohydrolase